ncbi:hypothetical protein, partial [Escherichia whittamii]|uniref:hypothetical protein n=1 Tax=Escherichia whittamii TaxID=2762229 RepID=UPI001CD89AD5
RAVATRFSALSRGGVYYAFLFQSQPLISGFFSSLFRPSCEVSHVVVSTEAHYRDPNFLHKYFFDLFFCLLFFCPFCFIRTQNGAFLHTKTLAQGK